MYQDLTIRIVRVLCTSSEYLNSSIWNNLGSSVTDNDAISPEGLQNAAKVQGDGSQNYIRLYDNLTYPSTGNYTLTFFAKKGNNDFIRVAMLGVTGAESAYFDLANGTTPQTNVATIQAIGTDGWYKCSVSANLTGPDLTGNYNLYVSYSDTTSTFPSAGDANGQYVYLYGCQLEQGSYATSYIPTYGSAVTRNGETCNSAGTSATFNDSEGVLFGEISALSNDQTNRRITISDGTNTNRVVFGYNQNSNQIFYFIIVGGSTIATGNYTLTDITDFHKVAVKYKVNDFALWIDGVERHTDNSGAIFAADTLSEMQFEQGAGGSLHFYGNTKQVIYIPTALTDAELADLTTL
jgi:hypothetical protein